MTPFIIVLIVGLAPVTQEAATSAGVYSIGDGDVWCGPRCAQFVLQLSGHEVNLEGIVDRLQVHGRRGSSLNSIQTLFNEYGLNWDVLYVDEPEAWLKGMGHPSIVHLTRDRGDIGHFVVAVEARDGFVSVWDGTAGMAELPADRLAARMSGYVLAPEGDYRFNWSRLAALMIGGIALLGGISDGLRRRRRVTSL
jgi:hypothetical protein